jgi:ABC-2 type transport system ATP-binding protein
MGAGPLLHASDLRKSYGARAAVAGVSFSAAPGEILGLLGPNGAGKSTTVAMICGLVRPDSGQVTIDGEPISGDSSAVKRRIGLVPQDLALYEELPALGNLHLFGALYGLSGTLLQTRCAEALSLVGLADRAQDKPKTFSGGMKRRLNLACALVHDPDLLLLDEPTAGVDPQSRNAIFDNLEALRQRGKTLIYTTHYMEEAERLCDRIVIVDHGAVVASDSLPGLLRLLPAAATIEITVEDAAQGRVDFAALGSVAGVKTAAQSGSTITVGVEALSATAPAVLAWFGDQGITIRHFRSGQGTLEDVFLALTGRQLRD